MITEQWAIELAQLFKQRNNIQKLGTLIGKVVEVDVDKEYVKISLLDGSLFLDKFYSLIKVFTEDDIGKKLLVTSSEDNQQFFVIGYVKEFTAERS